ncbi:sporulation protein [Radiobacillus deserti]|uniref:Sporulation protein n=1 Tax=Radiobacillus deserti TaxID=2594883 RepID=A0A516KKL6_9BACI|nr:sporulation protein [Radiobacillus deserti]QDP41937.1 sporulation protein [Radiobacillus deserti]
MLKKWLASVGIGSAKVDTQLENDQLTPGESLKGKVVVVGGSTEQQIDRINLFVMTEALREYDDKKFYEDVVLHKFTLGEAFTIGEGERKEIDFAFTLPVQTPPTIGKTNVWIQTGLDIPSALDPKDRDYIKVHAHPLMSTVLDALYSELKFSLRKVEMEYSKRLGFIQEFEFLPSNDFRADLDELEAYFFLKEDEMEVVLQVDRRAKGLGGLFAEALEMDESYARVTFSRSEIERGTTYIASQLRETIQRYS